MEKLYWHQQVFLPYNCSSFITKRSPGVALIISFMTRREAIQRAVALSGLALTSPAIIAALEGCRTETSLDWEPQFLSPEQVKVVGKIANRILPPTDTLGALDVGVDRFIDTMVTVMFPEAYQQAFVQQLDDFSLQDAAFVDDDEATQDQKLRLLAQTHAQAKAADPTLPPTFFQLIKQLTLLGYFTSEAVMEHQLNYHAIPGKYQACIPLGENPTLYVDNNVL